MEPEIEVIWKATQRVFIHDLFYLELDEFIDAHSLSADHGTIGHAVFWCEGIVFYVGYFSASELIQKMWLEGDVHFVYVEYAILPKYEAMLRNPKNNVTIPVQNVKVERWKQIISWIKKHGPVLIAMPKVQDEE